MNSRITLEDTTADMLVKMAEGNPGALMTMMELLDKYEAIDPQSFLGGVGAIMILDTWGIYGTEIYILHNDVCNRDIRRMILLLRATQLGIFPQSRLNSLASDQTRSATINDSEWSDLDEQVCAKLDKFQCATDIAKEMQL